MRARSFAMALVLAPASLAGLPGCGTPGATEAREAVASTDVTDADRRAKARLELASAYYARGQLETALDEVKLAMHAKPDLVEAHNLRGLIYAGLGDTALADSSFRRALQLQPRDADALHNYGWFLCQQQQFKDAIAQFDAALTVPQYRATSRTLAAKGLCQAQAGQWLEAEGSLMRSYELDAGNPATAMNLAEVLYRRADFERARFYVGRVNSRPESTNAQSLWLAARIENKLGNLARVSEFGEQLKSRFPRAPEAQLYERRRFDE
ncbi:MAG: type IV pilus biogenesis/stability protein PilW [Ideonella sp.]|jgi:type IV pilus assembly protein PilF|nr:type IV pilus biogenesis/stability protein PilW [Ideonella sp.]